MAMKRVDQPSAGFKCRCTPGWNFLKLEEEHPNYCVIAMDGRCLRWGDCYKKPTTVVIQFPYTTTSVGEASTCAVCGTFPFRIIKTPDYIKCRNQDGGGI